METVILLRMPSGAVSFVADDNGDIQVFPHADAAIKATEKMPIFSAGFPFQVVELDEL